ncbi:MAG: hypothetical protein CL965_02765 [Euryarchaeota archaeon]|jgi:hypothetical protein|nr:hypothetical protein [Euryarchaeota archaeon]
MWLQWWIALFLLISGYSMARMGPAFDRSRFGFLIFFAGLVLTLLPTEGLMSSEDAASESLRLTLSWAIPGVIGLYIVASGAPIYNESNLFKLLIGWSLTLYSMWAMLVSWGPDIDIIGKTVSSALGVSLTLIIYLYSIRITESISSGDSVTKPLEGDEIKHISEILLSNLGDMEAKE